MNVYRRLPRLVLLLLLAALLVACEEGGSAGDPATGTPTTSDAAPASGGVHAEPLVVLIAEDEGPLTPANYATFTGHWLAGWVYDGLFARDLDLNAVPALATQATPSEDGLTWKVRLREGVTWHDGEAFTAEDVVFSYDFLKDSGRAPNLAAVADVVANGDHQVTFQLAQPSPFFLTEVLAGYYVMPEHIWRDQEPVTGVSSAFEGRIGTGPYRLTEVVPGESYTFTANPDYYRGAPAVQSIIARIEPDRSRQFTQLRTGDAHAVLPSIPPAQVGQLVDAVDVELAEGSDFFNYVLYMNGSRPPFDQQVVRRAVALGIDTRSLVQEVLVGRGLELPVSWYHPDIPWATSIPHEYNPAAASETLEQAGFTDSDGDGVREYAGAPMSYEILCDADNQVEIRTAELIAGWLGEIGIAAEPNCVDNAEEAARIWPDFVAVPEPDYDLAVWGWSSGTQYQQGFLRGLLHSDFGGVGWGNLTGIADPQLDALLDEYVVSANAARTAELSALIQQRLAETMPWVPLMAPGGEYGYRPDGYDAWAYMRGAGIGTFWSLLPAAQR